MQKSITFQNEKNKCLWTAQPQEEPLYYTHPPRLRDYHRQWIRNKDPEIREDWNETVSLDMIGPLYL